MPDDTAVQTPIFEFMSLRSPVEIDPVTLRRNYIHDDLQPQSRILTHVPSEPELGGSVIGKLVCDMVLSGEYKEPEEGLKQLKVSLLDFLTPVTPVWQTAGGAVPEGGSQKISVAEFERHAHLLENGKYYLLPDRINLILDLSVTQTLQHVITTLAELTPRTSFEVMSSQLVSVFDGQSPGQFVFSGNTLSASFIEINRRLFDVLYLLYIARRWATVDLGEVMAGLRALHVIEAMAILIIRDTHPLFC